VAAVAGVDLRVLEPGLRQPSNTRSAPRSADMLHGAGLRRAGELRAGWRVS